MEKVFNMIFFFFTFEYFSSLLLFVRNKLFFYHRRGAHTWGLSYKRFENPFQLCFFFILSHSLTLLVSRELLKLKTSITFFFLCFFVFEKKNIINFFPAATMWEEEKRLLKGGSNFNSWTTRLLKSFLDVFFSLYIFSMASNNNNNFL